jgi:hypothetical protein
MRIDAYLPVKAGCPERKYRKHNLRVKIKNSLKLNEISIG